MKKTYIFYLLLVGLVFSFSGCKLFDKEEQEPSYVIIDTVGVNPNYAECGSSSHQISDVWVYVDDKLLGCFELPARVPVLEVGSHKVTFLAGVKVNGIGATRATYPFYAAANYQLVLSPDSALHIKPMFDFDRSMVLVMNEDFESAGVSFQKVDLSDTTIKASNSLSDLYVNTQDPTEVSTYSGAISLDTTRSDFEIETISAYSLPKNGTYIFLEFNYKCTTPVVVGSKAYYSGSMVKSPLVVLNPTSTWRKMYVNLTVAVSRETTALNYRIYFAGGLRSGATEDRVVLDNIKLVRAKVAK